MRFVKVGEGTVWATPSRSLPKEANFVVSLKDGRYVCSCRAGRKAQQCDHVRQLAKARRKFKGILRRRRKEVTSE